MPAPRFRLCIPDPYVLNGNIPLSIGWLRVMVRWTTGPMSARLMQTAEQSGVTVVLRDILATVQACADVADPDTGIIYGDGRLVEQALTGGPIPDRALDFVIATLVYSGYLQDLRYLPLAALTEASPEQPTQAEQAAPEQPAEQPAEQAAPQQPARCFCGDPNCPGEQNSVSVPQ